MMLFALRQLWRCDSVEEKSTGIDAMSQAVALLISYSINSNVAN